MGGQVQLEIKKVSCRHHPDAANLYYLAPGRRTEYQVDDDYYIDGIDDVLKHLSIESSRLIWQTLMHTQVDWSMARYCTNLSQPYRTAPSKLALSLKTNKWIPQADNNFVMPVDASVALLPDGFPIDKRWSWLGR